MIVSEELGIEVICTACQKEPATYNYAGYAEGDSYLNLCFGCLSALQREIAGDIFIAATGHTSLDEYFGKEGEMRMIRAGFRLGGGKLDDSSNEHN